MNRNMNLNEKCLYTGIIGSGHLLFLMAGEIFTRIFMVELATKRGVDKICETKNVTTERQRLFSNS